MISCRAMCQIIIGTTWLSHIFHVVALLRTFLWETAGKKSSASHSHSSPFVRDAQRARLNTVLTWESPREECQVTGHVEEGGSGPSDPEQMVCRKPIVKNRGLKREGGRDSPDLEQRFAAKRKTCLVAPPPHPPLKNGSHNTPVQVAAEGECVRL